MVEIETKYGAGRPRSPLRQSTHIKRKPAANLYWAVRVAERIERPLNQFVSINFALTACNSTHVALAFERLRDNHFCPWLRRPPKKQRAYGPPAFVWVIENAGGCTNVHWLVHVPTERLQDFRARMPRWLKAVTGDFVREGALHIQPAKTPKLAGRYMLKGIDPIFARLYGVEDPKPQGMVHGKRSGFSRGLGPTVRRRLGMKPKRRYFEQEIRPTV